MAQVTYDPDSTMRAARERYFSVNGFGPDGGYHDPWVHLKLGPLPVSFPNTAGRVRAVRYHDLHHIITGYATDNVGEFEISAWEIGAGCSDFWAAWLLNLSGMAGGVLRAPKRTLRAFLRGRASYTLYGRDVDLLLEQTVAQVREHMGIHHADRKHRVQLLDVLAFASCVAAGLVTGTLLLVFGVLASPLLLLLSLRAPKRAT